MKKKQKGFLAIRTILLYLLFLAITAVSGWQATQALTGYARREVIQEAEAITFSLTNSVNSEIDEADKIAHVLSGSPGIIQALASRDPGDIEAANAVLDRYAGSLHYAVAYILDPQGKTLASSNRNESDSFVGKNYSFRPYFQEAVKGLAGRYFAFGVTSGRRGYYGASPCYDNQKNLLGVVVIKKEIDSLAKVFNRFKYCFLVDPNGIIFLSSKPELVLKSLWPVHPQAAQALFDSNQFGEGPFEAVSLMTKNDNQDAVFNRERYILKKVSTGLPGWSIVYLASLGRVHAYRLLGVGATSFLCLLLFSFAVAMYIVNKNSQNAQLLAAIVESSEDAIIGKTLKGKILSWNEGARKTYGYTAQEMIGENVTMLAPPEKEKEIQEILERIKKGQGVFHLETQRVTKDGRKIAVSLSVSCIKDRRGRVIGASSIARDITHQKRLMEALAKERQSLLSIFDNIDEIVYVSDPKTYELLYFNNALKKRWPNAQPGLLCHQVIQGLENPCPFCTNKEIFGENFGKTYVWEFQNLTDKHWYRCIDKGIPWTDGRPVRYEMAIDITDSKKTEMALAESEQRFKTLVANLPGAIYRCANDKDWTMQFISPSIENICGYSALDFIDNSVRSFASIIYSEDAALVDNAIQQGVNQKRPYQIEYRICHRDGRLLWVSEKGQGVFNDKGDLLCLDGAIFNITEEKEAREKIKNAKKYTDLIFALAPSAIFTVDKNKIVTKWNKKAEEITGYSAKEVVGKICLLFADLPCRECCGLFSDEITKPISSKECTIKRKDGAVRVISKNADLLRDEKGNIIGGIESFEDITEKKEAERIIQESEEKYRHLVENANSIILRLDERGRITFFNEFAEQFFGFQKEEILGQEALGTIVPQKSGDGQEMGQTIQTILADPQKYQYNENENICKDGRRVWVRWANRISENPKTKEKELLCVGADVTEIRKAQQELLKLSRAVEQSPSTVVITDAEGIIEYVNPKFCQLTGYTFEEAVGQNPRVLKSEKQPAEFYKDLWDTITRGKEWRGEFCNKKKNGDFYWEFASISPIRDEKGKTTHYIAVKEDITARKEAEEKAQEAMRMKSEFISVVSHELRTPLTAIKEGISIVVDGVTGELNKEQEEFLDVAKRNVERLARLINDVLDFQKLDTSQMTFELVAQDIEPVIKEVVATMNKVAEKENVELKADIQKNLPQISFDHDRITQVVTNLVSNAIKYAGGKPVIIQARQEGNTLKVSIIDHGEGIKEDDFSKLFQTFSQLKKGKERKTGSTGLGLAISKKIIQEHNGKIWVESKLGQGSAFCFILPIEERRTKEGLD